MEGAGQTTCSFDGLTAQPLSRGSILSQPISIMTRTLDPTITAALDAVEPGRLPRLRLIGGVEQLRRELARSLNEAGFGPKWLAEWLSSDAIFLARLYEDITRTSKLRLRLEAVEDNACRKFHADHVRFRLVTTYRGPGTEWIPPDLLAISSEGATFPASAIRRLDRGCVAVMRGARAATTERPAPSLTAHRGNRRHPAFSRR